MKLRANYDQTLLTPLSMPSGPKIGSDTTDSRPLLTARPPTKRFVKQCPQCGLQGKCTDSRPYEGRIRRRYACTVCPQRWSTVEVLVDDVAPMTQENRAGLQRTANQLEQLLGAFRRFLG